MNDRDPRVAAPSRDGKIDRGDRDWWKRAVFYQIYPRSFQDSGGDGVGDLAGITSRLDYLNDGTRDSLGIDAIWISPFYRSPMADFGYDVADYCDVDPIFGTLDDFDRLVAAAHEHGIRIVIDFVPNHTSDRHAWFEESRSSRDNPRRDWYIWADPAPDGGPPNNWQAHFRGVGSAWTLDPATGQYYLHSFLPEQPDLNWWNPEVRAAMEDVLRFWLDRGVDGFRIDVAHLMLKDRELRDNPDAVQPDGVALEIDEHGNIISGQAERPFMDRDLPEVHEIHRSWRRLLDSYGDRMAVGEVYILDPAKMVRYYGESGDELALAFNFSFLRQPWVAEAFRSSADLFEAVLPTGAWPDYTLSNHDVSRARSRYDTAGGDGPLGLARARVGAMMLLTLRGTPFIYQAEEIGQADGEVPEDRVVDPDGRDPERTPVQWQPGPGAGFTTGDPWLPIGSGAHRENVAVLRDDPASILTLYRRLLWYRKGSPALLSGSYHSLAAAPRGVFAYIREAGSEHLFVALNFTAREILLRGPALALPPRGKLVISTSTERPDGDIDLTAFTLAPNEGFLVELPA